MIFKVKLDDNEDCYIVCDCGRVGRKDVLVPKAIAFSEEEAEEIDDELYQQ